MASALLSTPLGTTPPQYNSTSIPRRSNSNVVAFRTSTSDDVSGSSMGRTPNSLADINSWRSMSRSSKDLNEAARLKHTSSIPKSASFIKIEGFETAGTSATPSPMGSPDSKNSLGKASSLLTRQLSLDNITATLSSHGSGDSSTLVQRLEERVAINLQPVPRPASLPRRSSVPEDLLTQLQSRHPIFKEPLVARAFNISRLAHDGRYNGPTREPAFNRCISSAVILAELGADEATMAGVLLHDALDHTMLLEGQLRQMLGSDEVIDLVKRVSHVNYVCGKFLTTATPGSNAMMSPFVTDIIATNIQPAGGLVDMLVATCNPRALLIRLAVALYEARSQDGRASSGMPITPRSEGDRHRSARDSLAVWAPLANRLGVWSLKAELEDRAFRTLHPSEHAALKERLEEVQSPARLVALADRLRAELQAQGIEYMDLSGRPKHLWGVWCKMKNKGYKADQIADVRGLRIIVRNREDCYRAMRAVETVWQLSGDTKNYIKNPKENGYQSLHAVADAGDGHKVEIQIRTDKMHYLAEYGAQAAHWRYKEKSTTAVTASANSDATQAANWAKFVTSKQVVADKKCRPSGSPDQDQSLDSILASIDLVNSSPGSSPPELGKENSRNSRTFVEYIEASGQRPAPPAEQTLLVAVASEGRCSIIEVAAGTTLQGLIDQCGAQLYGASNGIQVIVNQHMASSYNAVLHAGDMVELYAEQPAPTVPAVPRLSTSGAARGNLMPLNGLRRPATAALT